MSQGFCPVCWGFVPIVSQNVGKALGGAAAAFFGIGARTASGKFLGAIASLLVGYLVDEAAGPVCGKCGAPLRSVV
jgi:hypothetical protein